MDSKKLVLLLPLLLTACSSVQLKREPQQHEATMIHIQPYEYDSLHIPAFVCHSEPDKTPIFADWLRAEDIGHPVTVYYTHDGYYFTAEGTLNAIYPDAIKLDEHFSVFMLGAWYPLNASEYIHLDQIEFVLVEGTGEPF